MGRLTRILVLLLTTISSYIFYIALVAPHPVPIVEDEYWGPKIEQEEPEDTSVRPFPIDVPDAVINDLKIRLKQELKSNRFIPPLEGIGFEYGFKSDFAKTLGTVWLEKYDWKQREKLLNRYPHFKTKIGGLDIHFQHVTPTTSKKRASRPILILHGWPGSFVEFQKIIPLLSEPKNSQYNYELVIPSLPGYGFSDGAARRGMSPTEIGNIFKRLMKRLGHDRFFIMGDDFGAFVATDMATVYPENIIAVQAIPCYTFTVIANLRHLLATFFPRLLIPPQVERKVLPFFDFWSFMIRETGYAHMHVTKPDTLGIALTHSPLGLMTYILEKFSIATNRKWISRQDGGLLENFGIDELLDNVMIYWITGSITTSMRLYAEVLDPAKKHELFRVPTYVPFSCLVMPEDIVVLPEFVLKEKYKNITKFSMAKRGGHFGAFEEPELVAEDAISHFDKH